VRKSAAGICRPPRWETAAICTLLSRVASPEVLQRLRWRNWALFQARRPPHRRLTAAHAASAPPPCLRGSVVEVVRMAVATLAACLRLRVAYRRRLYSVSDGATMGGAPGFTPTHQPLHRAGDAGRHDLGTTPRLRRTRNVHSLGLSANAWDAMWGTLGVYATARGRLLQVASDEIRWRQASWPNFINGANSALLSPRTQSFYQTIPCESHVIGSSNTSAVTSLRA
jgi:hypothetical protein